MNILDQVAIFDVDFDIWTGRTRLTATDIKLGEGGSIPPADLATLGSKNVCDPKLLRAFSAIKQRMTRYMESIGMRFMNGYAVPMTRVDEVSRELNVLQDEFYRARDLFLASYQNAVEEWCDSNPSWSDIIRDGLTKREVVAERLGMRWEVFQISSGDLQSSGTNGVENKAKRLGGDLLKEVMDTAIELYATHLSKPVLYVSFRVRKPLKLMRDKLDGLSFLDHRFSTLVKMIDEALAFLPEASKEPVHGEGYYRISAVVQILSDELKLEQYVLGVTSIMDVETALQTPCADNMASAASAPSSDQGDDILKDMDKKFDEIFSSHKGKSASGFF